MMIAINIAINIITCLKLRKLIPDRQRDSRFKLWLG